jgi:hypothetical protein
VTLQPCCKILPAASFCSAEHAPSPEKWKAVGSDSKICIVHKDAPTGDRGRSICKATLTRRLAQNIQL